MDNSPAQPLARKGRRYWPPLALFAMAVVLQCIANYSSLYFYYPFGWEDVHPSIIISIVFQPFRGIDGIFLFLGLVLPVLCLVLSKSGKGCKALGISCLLLAGFQLLLSVVYARVRGNLWLIRPIKLAFLFRIPGTTLVQVLLGLIKYSIVCVPRRIVQMLFFVLADLHFLAANVVAGICFLRSARR